MSFKNQFGILGLLEVWSHFRLFWLFVIKTSHQLLHLFRRMLQRFFCCDLWVKCSFNKCKSLAVDLDHVKPKLPKSVEFVLCTISVQIFH